MFTMGENAMQSQQIRTWKNVITSRQIYAIKSKTIKRLKKLQWTKCNKGCARQRNGQIKRNNIKKPMHGSNICGHFTHNTQSLLIAGHNHFAWLNTSGYIPYFTFTYKMFIETNTLVCATASKSRAFQELTPNLFKFSFFFVCFFLRRK